MMKSRAYKISSFLKKNLKGTIIERTEEDVKQKKGGGTYDVPVSMIRPVFLLLVISMMYNL
ncbi:MAG TPA: hypothetical protein EYN89_01740 [Flavobacteriales bacterium]|nr:hypothetical protein [Flavobacteriales bacterium]